MPSIEDKLSLTNVRFPNGVTFRKAETWDGNYIFICNDCAKVGVAWNYTVSRAELATRYDREEYISLYKHADLHNPLCKRLELMVIAKNPVIRLNYDYDAINDKIIIPDIEEIPVLIKKPKRMFRLRE
jgi:hypothetical protein